MFQQTFALTAPLFLLVFLGYAIAHWGRWPESATDALTRFVFSVALPMLLFRLMAGFRSLPPTDARLLIAYFGACLVVFALGRIAARFVFGMDGIGQSVFGLGGVFSNNVLLGVPLARITLGETSIPAVSLILVFNALTLWTLVTISIELARHETLSLKALIATARGVSTNPLILGIIGGTLFGYTGLGLPGFVDQTLGLVGQAAAPLSLIVLGMGLSRFGLRADLRESMAMCVFKLVVFPLVAYLLARALGLPALETRVVVLLAALPTGANVYLMSRQFNTLGGAVASSLVLSTALGSVTTPMALSWISVLAPQ